MQSISTKHMESKIWLAMTTEAGLIPRSPLSPFWGHTYGRLWQPRTNFLSTGPTPHYRGKLSNPLMDLFYCYRPLDFCGQAVEEITSDLIEIVSNLTELLVC